MVRLRKTGVLVVLLLALNAGAMHAAGDAADVAEDLVTTTLDNGLRVSILPVSHNPVVATQVWYHVGSAHEGPSSRGFAHLFEHLMFGRTESVDQDAWEQHHHDHGGSENAYTSFDETVYVSEIAPAFHRRVLEMEADRMHRLVLEQESLDNEKKVVAEELRLRTENDPFDRVWISALAQVLGDHPYAHPPVGTQEDIAAANLESCRRFYQRYYRPGNAHLVVVGPVDADQTLGQVRELFGVIPAGGRSPPEIPTVIGRTFPREILEISEDLPPAEIALVAYALPPLGGADHWAIEVLRQLLGGGSVDPFEEPLANRRRKAIYAGTYWLQARRGGAVVFAAGFVPYRRRSTAFRLMGETVEELARLEWLSDESLASAKKTLIRREMKSVFFAERRAESLGRAGWWLGDERLAFDGAQRIEDVSRKQVAEAFHRYISRARPVRVYIKPEHVPLWVRLFGWAYPLVN